jgi:hypothetical protein
MWDTPVNLFDRVRQMRSVAPDDTLKLRLGVAPKAQNGVLSDIHRAAAQRLARTFSILRYFLNLI